MKDIRLREATSHGAPDFPMQYYYVDESHPRYEMTLHWHSEFEINCILYGKGEFICGDHKFITSEGDILLLPPNMLHAAYPYENNDLVYDALVFHPVMLGANSNDRCTTECIRPVMNGTIKINLPIRSTLNNYSELKSTVERIFSYAHGNRSQLDLLLKSELLRLFWLIENDEKNICRTDADISYSEIVRPALEFMMKNFQEDISIEQLAELVHLSKSYFMGCFKKAVGVGAIEHLTQLRINAACEALSNTDTLISDIAFNCGYSNLSNFNRQFKKIVGCSPNEYKKRNTTSRSYIH